jgi:hypothetical protein
VALHLVLSLIMSEQDVTDSNNDSRRRGAEAPDDSRRRGAEAPEELSAVFKQLVINLPANSGETKELHDRLLEQVKHFFTDVIVPMKEAGGFPESQTRWFYSIYKEGLESMRMQKSSFSNYIYIAEQDVLDLVKLVNECSLVELHERGMSFVSNSMSVISNYFRDQAVFARWESVYSHGKPIDWINKLCGDSHHSEALSQKFPPEVISAIQKLGLIMKT